VRLRPGYALVALGVFAVEVLIALHVHDAIVRPLVGDALAVVLVYLGLRAVTPLGVRAAALWALGIAFAIEAVQGLRLLERLGVPSSGVLGIVLGSTFDPRDLAAYTAGAVAVVVVEAVRARR
jgi:hypothetical protein